MNKKTEITHSYSHSTNFTPFQTYWIPNSSKLISVGQFNSQKGKILIQQLQNNFTTNSSDNSPLLQTTYEIEKSSPIRCAAFGIYPVEHRYLITGQFNGCISIWDINNGLELPIWSSNSSNVKHNTIVNSIATTNKNGRPEFLSSSRNGEIFLWDARTPSPVISFESKKSPKADCWSVRFDTTDDNIVYVGDAQGNLKNFDLRIGGLVWEKNLNQNGICTIDFGNFNDDSTTKSILCSCLNSQTHLFKTHTINKNASLPLTSSQTIITKPYDQSTIWTSKYIPQQPNQFVSCTGNGRINLYKQFLKEDQLQIGYEEIASKQVSDCGIIHFDWNEQKEGLFCFSCLDNSINIGFVTNNK